MRQMLLGRSLFLILLGMLSGCATVFTGTKQHVHFDSDPSGARILVNGIEMGKTPATLHLNKPGFGTTTITLRLAGYEDRSFILEKSFNAVSLINFIGFLPWVVDFVTGAFMNYSPEGYNMALTKKAQAELRRKLDVEEVIFASSLKCSDKGLVIDPVFAGKKIAILDEKTHQIIVLQ